MSLLANLLTVKAKLDRMVTQAEKKVEASDFILQYTTRVLRADDSSYPARKARAMNELAGRLSLGLEQVPFVSAVIETFAQDVVELASVEAEKIETRYFETSEELKASKEKLVTAQRAFLQELVALKQRTRSNNRVESEISSKFFDPLSALDAETRALVEAIIAERTQEISDHFLLHSVPVESHLALRKSLEQEISDLRAAEARRLRSIANFHVTQSEISCLDDDLVRTAQNLRKNLEVADLEIATLQATIDQLGKTLKFLEQEISDHKKTIAKLYSELPPPPPEIAHAQTSTDKVFFGAEIFPHLEISTRQIDTSLSVPPIQISDHVSASVGNSAPDSRRVSTPLVLISPPQPLLQFPIHKLSDRPPLPAAPRRHRVADCPPVRVEEEIFELPSFLQPEPPAFSGERRRPEWKVPGKAKAKLDLSRVPLKPAEFRQWKSGDVIGILNKHQIHVTEIYPMDP